MNAESDELSSSLRQASWASSRLEDRDLNGRTRAWGKLGRNPLYLISLRRCSAAGPIHVA
jgi:hypothetical protein